MTDVSQDDVTCPEGEHLAEVSQETEEILKRSFMSLKNLRDSRLGMPLLYRW